MMNVKKDAQRLLAKAKKNGYVVVGGKSGHYKVRHPHTGHMLACVSATPADGLALVRIERDLRLAGCLEPLEAA
jgi:hypothetical protein